MNLRIDYYWNNVMPKVKSTKNENKKMQNININVLSEAQKSEMIARFSILSHSTFVCIITLIGVYWSIATTVNVDENITSFWISSSVIWILIWMLFICSTKYYLLENKVKINLNINSSFIVIKKTKINVKNKQYQIF